MLPQVSRKSRHQWAVRVATGAVLVSAFVIPLFLGTPEELPSIALGSAFVLYLEYFFVILLVGTLALTLVFRGMWSGQVPLGVSKDGLTWPEEVTAAAIDGLDALQEQIDSLEADLLELADRAVLKPAP
jgi:hypothetical protein